MDHFCRDGADIFGCWLDSQQRIQHVSPQVTSILGWDANSLRGQTWSDLDLYPRAKGVSLATSLRGPFPFATFVWLPAGSAPASAEGAVSWLWQLRDAAAKPRWLHCRSGGDAASWLQLGEPATPARTPPPRDEVFPHRALWLQDVTSLVQLTECCAEIPALRTSAEAHAKCKQLSRRVAHDLNNSLTAMYYLVDTLSAAAGDSPLVTKTRQDLQQTFEQLGSQIKILSHL